MKNLKKMSNKTAQVVMLPTNDNTFLKKFVGNINKLFFDNNNIVAQNQHLHFVTDDPIEKYDWVTNTKVIVKYNSIDDIPTNSGWYKKIIASTDPALRLPTIPLTWIRDVFVPSNDTINEVELKVNYYCKLGDSLAGCNRNCDCSEETRYLELTPINEVVITNTPQAKALALAEELLPTLQNAAIDYLKKVKSPALNTSWQQFDIDIFKAGVEWQKKYSDKRWTDEDMKSAWKQAEGKTWDEEHGYYSPDFEEWLTELKQEKFKENE